MIPHDALIDKLAFWTFHAYLQQRGDVKEGNKNEVRNLYICALD
jgi:hypothetical protein